MENQKYPVDITLAADADQYQLLLQGGGGTFAPTAGATAGNEGAQLVIAQFTGESGDVISGNFIGVDKVIASAAIDRFAEVVPAAAGRVATLASQTGVAVIGKAIEPAAAAGDVIRVALYTEPRLIPA